MNIEERVQTLDSQENAERTQAQWWGTFIAAQKRPPSIDVIRQAYEELVDAEISANDKIHQLIHLYANIKTEVDPRNALMNQIRDLVIAIQPYADEFTETKKGMSMKTHHGTVQYSHETETHSYPAAAIDVLCATDDDMRRKLGAIRKDGTRKASVSIKLNSKGA